MCEFGLERDLSQRKAFPNGFTGILLQPTPSHPKPT